MVSATHLISETAFAKVTNDLLIASDQGFVYVLVLLDRFQFVQINDESSVRTKVNHGVPQGSVLGPILFSLYMLPRGNIIRTPSVNFHCYADDTQLYLSIKPEQCHQLTKIQACPKDIKTWMNRNFLLLNSDKTEVLILGPKHLRDKLPNDIAALDDIALAFNETVRNLGVIVTGMVRTLILVRESSVHLHLHGPGESVVVLLRVGGTRPVLGVVAVVRGLRRRMWSGRWPGSGCLGEVASMEVPDEGAVQDVPPRDPGPFFRAVTLPVHQVLESPPTPARLQEATDSVGGTSIDEARRRGGGGGGAAGTRALSRTGLTLDT